MRRDQFGKVKIKSRRSLLDLSEETTSVRLARKIELRKSEVIEHTLETIEIALRINNGSLSRAAEDLGIERSVLKRKIAYSPSLEKVLQDIREQKVDVMEEKLFEQIENGNVTAITFGLRTLGKERGYTERSTVEHEVGGTIRDAASLIESMRKGKESIVALPGDEPETVDIKDYEWVESDEA